jgi:pimeloyl-ACP methyl ester carboxylesterase
MLTAEPLANTNTDMAFRRNGEGDCAVVFVHGFLDDQHVWDEVIAALETPGFERVQLDLAGCGERAAATGPFTYERYAADVGAVVDALEKPFVIVGQSMGAAIAELVAAAHPARALGLVLLAPVPLAGTRLPDEAIEPFRALGGNQQAQRAAREQLSVGMSDAGLERLVEMGLPMRSDVVRAMADCWNSGLADAPERSEYRGPVLIVRGAGDDFVTEGLVSTTVSPRFASARTVTVEGAGHWPHVERPADVVAQLDDFLTNAVAPRSQAWREAFANKSAEEFEDAFADNVVLEGSTLRRPIEGRDLVKQVMGTASGIYDSLVFTHEASNGLRTYVEWEATAFDGMALDGVTILTKNDDGQIVSARIHHRPLRAVLRFSSELRERLHGVVDPSYFHGGSNAAR